MILKLTRPDGETVYIPKDQIIKWTKAPTRDDKTEISLGDGFQIVKEAPEQIYEMMK